MIIVLAHSHLNTPHLLSPSLSHRLHVTVMKRDHYASTDTDTGTDTNTGTCIGTGTNTRQISPNKMRWKANRTKETEVAAAAAAVAAAATTAAAAVAAVVATAAAAVAAAMVVTNIWPQTLKKAQKWKAWWRAHVV